MARRPQAQGLSARVHGRDSDRLGILWPLAAGALTVALWRVPHGRTALWPFSLLATWFHEMGHGLTALALGGRFEKLLLYADGSGLAVSGAPRWLGSLGSAAVAAGGPLGPAAAGALLIVASRRFSTARAGLWLLGLALIGSGLAWTRSVFGFGFTLAAGALVLLTAARAGRETHGFAAQFLGVQACLSAFQELDYMFSASATVGGRPMASDSARIAELIGGAYFIWGGAMAVTAVALLGLSLRFAYRR
ncbi:MAG: M50 family metallopeptidase [Elusimicrobia bacterium]|nr:M50 family metallopeptidase [Elusimicrobiota bacterium]